jgi:hypothetical protein
MVEEDAIINVHYELEFYMDCLVERADDLHHARVLILGTRRFMKCIVSQKTLVV